MGIDQNKKNNADGYSNKELKEILKGYSPDNKALHEGYSPDSNETKKPNPPENSEKRNPPKGGSGGN